MDEKELMAQYGMACVNLEIAQAKHNELKRQVAEFLNKKVEDKPKE